MISEELCSDYKYARHTVEWDPICVHNQKLIGPKAKTYDFVNKFSAY
jgi:hypothetical protein